ncbi:GNAT family N-acetyltransferase [Anaerosporobacter faecicola]|uniref:GNAT family N-acetyltransferase n=1 Tax=Anaerosporobacter faecicola TaxID=2718714 RepID=UPI001EE5BD4D|nr:GNAT family N-acetyltransferase [Anaerosporobacter faecicola]
MRNKKMNVTLRLGKKTEIHQLEKLYDDVNEYLEANINYPGWKKGIYPTREDAENGIEEGTLYVAEAAGEIVGSLILRHKPEPAYASATWQTDVEYEKILVIYTFVVDPKKQGQGIGRKMLEQIEELAKNLRMRALRLDVYEKNTPAIHLYQKCGFQYIGTVSLGLEEIGLNWFQLYEKLVEV